MILIAAIKESSNLQSRHVVRVCVLKGIPPLSLVADSDCRLDKSCGRPRLRGVKTWVRFGGLWDVYVPSEDGDEREGAVCLRNAW